MFSDLFLKNLKIQEEKRKAEEISPLSEVFNFNDKPISMRLDDGRVYVNMTEVAKVFPKKNLSTIINSKEMQEYISALAEIKNFTSADLLVVTKGGNNKSAQGTWAYSKVAIRIAQKLSPVFAVWVDTKVEELFSYGKTQLTSKPVEEKPKEQPFDRLGLAEFLDRQADSGNFSPLYSQMIRTESVNIAAGRELLPMPETPKQEESFTPKQVGKKVSEALGLDDPVTANMIGKIAKAFDLKTEDNGITRETFAPNGKQVPVFYYYRSSIDKVIEAAKKYIEKNPGSKLAKAKADADMRKLLDEA